MVCTITRQLYHDAKTDYDPFIGLFTSQEIQTMINELRATKCPKSMLGVVPWLTFALSEHKKIQDAYDEYTKYSYTKKLQYLKI